MKKDITNRLTALRATMIRKGISAFIVPSTDPHSGEYVPEYWETRKWISGFTGSAGTVVITLDKAGLWTDSRYFLQAEEQLEGTGIILFKERVPGTPTIANWLGQVLQPNEKVGIDGWVNTVSEAENLILELKKYHLSLITIEDPFISLWQNRPSLPSEPIFILPETYSGRSCKEKLDLINNELQKSQANALLLSSLDEIAWTLNLRGKDVHCNPVFVSYLLITPQANTLYIYPEKINQEVMAYLGHQQVQTKPYTAIEQDLKDIQGMQFLLPPTTNFTLYQTIATQNDIIRQTSPVTFLKAIKNETEIAGFHKAMKRDGVAMVRFLKWLKETVRTSQETEMSIDQKLYELRAEQDEFQGISFDTIAGYQEHGAIVHYEATPETSSQLKAEGLLLLDSGAQYLDGTTDITRTISLGPVTEEQKKDYTLVLKGFIALSTAEFPHGTCGTQLDILARQYMWKNGINYGHGTGHGVGHFLNVHEGPHQIRMNYVPAPLLPGMTITNEPGIYKAGKYGIRTENTMLVVPSRETEFGVFYKFEPLTLCPIDQEAILPEMLTTEEKTWLNQYHKNVYEALSPMLSETEKQWLRNATLPLS
ncbi:aminopeptidase P family protein [Phocaeicola coprophilus]|uniref:aminopeptidase P family protein n=1 Tax=Phocaeicola coprophilus TaxID=387090 RepID=UPI00265B2EC1|nr:aminopeptidase P family protein [Phocaeicola coprophilus]